MNLRCIVVAAALSSILGCAQKEVVPEWTPPPIELNPDRTLVCDDPAAPGCAVLTPFDELIQRSLESPADAKPHYVRLLNEGDETLLVQSGKPVGVFKTHANAPRVLIANSNLVPHWADWEHFNELDRQGLMMYGQMTAGSWIYIGSQGIVQGTYETFVEAGRQHYGGDLTGKWILTAGLGGDQA